MVTLVLRKQVNLKIAFVINQSSLLKKIKRVRNSHKKRMEVSEEKKLLRLKN